MYRSACAAPSIQLRLDPNGLVTTCCKSLQPLGNIRRERLIDIWQGHQRAQIVDALERDDFSVGCQRCGSEIALEGRDVSYAAIHDEWADHLTTDPASRTWPIRMEFNLSNACNLQCIQCDGDSSSMIRLHREGRPPLPEVYDDRFFEDLELFLPHLGRIVFGGGEPFLSPENYRVWDLIAEMGVDVDCQVVTNATQLTPRIERILERIPFSFVFSLDGITKTTYESIRVGADFDRVMANVDWFTAYARERGTLASVNHCLMPQNAHEFGDLLLWAESKNLFVNVSVVRYPATASIAELDVSDIRRIDQVLEAADAIVRPQLHLNRRTWDGERARIAAWAADGSDSRTVLWFRSNGSGPTDSTAAREDLGSWSADGVVHSIAVGADDLIRASDVSFLADPSSLVGGHYQELTKAIVARYGNMNDYEVIATTDDQVDARACFGDTPSRIITVALRDADGHADRAEFLVAFADARADQAGAPIDPVDSGVAVAISGTARSR